jgi:Transposase
MRALAGRLHFKVRAVQLSNEPGVMVKDVAESLDIHPFIAVQVAQAGS